MVLFDPDVRRRLLRELRRRRTCEQAALTPTQRLERLEQMHLLADSLRPSLPIQKSPTDEAPELWLRLLRRWRSLPREPSP